MTQKKTQLLGKQLGSHMSESAGISASTSDRFAGFIPSESATGAMSLDRIMEDDQQPRKHYDQQALKDFAEHLKSHGVQQPIQLRWNEQHQKWVIVYGHRRFRAARLAGMNSIPCIFTDEQLDEPTIRIRQLVENCQREDLTPLEMARAIQDLVMITGWTHRRIGDELGFSHVTIGRHLDLLKLPDDLQQKVESGELAASVAIDVLRIKDAAGQSKVGRAISEGRLNRRQAAELVDAAVTDADSRSAVRRTKKPSEILAQNSTIIVYRSRLADDREVHQELQQVMKQLETNMALT
ncbi:MAG: hypothetical protein Fues2KO_04320 [Fuerstiella sp.]